MDKIERLYKDPKIGLTSYERFRQKLTDMKVKYDPKALKEFISGQKSQEQNKPVQKRVIKRKFIPFIVNRVGEVVQSDLADISKYSRTNNGIKFLCITIDVYSRFVWVTPIKQKTQEQVFEAIKEVYDDMIKNDYLWTQWNIDDGNEWNKSQKFLQDKGLVVSRLSATKSNYNQHPTTPHVERVVRTLREMLNKYMIETDNTKYIDVLQDIVSNYNNSKHSETKLTPKAMFDGERSKKVQQDNAEKNKQKKHVLALYKIGDIVRVLTSSRLGKKDSNYSAKTHKITGKNGYGFIVEGFDRPIYAWQMQKVSRDFTSSGVDEEKELIRVENKHKRFMRREGLS